MAYENLIGQNLYINNLKTQLEGNIANYKYENACYAVIDTKVHNFCNEQQLQGCAISGLQNQMSNYSSVIGALSYANNLDILDTNSIMNLLSSAPHNKYDGEEIANNYNEAERDYNAACADESKYQTLSTYCTNPKLQKSYESSYKSALRAAENAKKRMEKYRALALELLGYINISSDYFSRGSSIRNLANRGLSQISCSYNVNTSSYSTIDSSWKNDLYTEECKDMYIDGQINWDVVESIVDKDPDAITKTEYSLLSDVYLSIDNTSDLSTFFDKCCTVKNPIYQTLAIRGCVAQCELNSKLLENIYDSVDTARWTLLQSQKQTDDIDLTNKYQKERKEVIQHLAILKALENDAENTQYYYKYVNDNVFNFSGTDFGYGKNTGIYISYDSVVSDCAAYNRLDHIYISEAFTSDNLTYLNSIDNKNTVDTISSSAGMVLTSDARDEVLNKAIEQGGKMLIGDASELLLGPLGFLAGVIGDIGQQQEINAYVKNTWTNAQIKDSAQMFDCEGILIIDKYNNEQLNLFEGVETESRMNSYNAYVSTYDDKGFALNSGYNLTVESLLKDPVGAFSAVDQYKYDHSDSIDNFNDIFE